MASASTSKGNATSSGSRAMASSLLRTDVASHRGVRHLIGGDYGFAWSPHGLQARDLKYFIDYYGYSAEEALICATRNGGQAE